MAIARFWVRKKRPGTLRIQIPSARGTQICTAWTTRRTVHKRTTIRCWLCTLPGEWSIFRSPLLFGGDLRKSDDWTHSLLSEPYLIDAHQNGRDPKEVYRKEDLVIWVSESDTRKYVACFNLADRPVGLPVAAREWLQSLGGELHEVWANRAVSVADAETAFIAPHGVALYISK